MGGGVAPAWAPPAPLGGGDAGAYQAALLPALESAATSHVRALCFQLLEEEGFEGDTKAWAPVLARLAGEAAACLLAHPARPAGGGLTLDPRACLELVDGGGREGGPPACTVECDARGRGRARLVGLPSPAALPALAGAARSATYAAWRCGVEAAFLADSLASCCTGRPSVPAARPSDRPILSASPHVSFEGGPDAGLSTFASAQRLWVCGMVAAPGGGGQGAPAAGAPCAPPRPVRLPFYSSELGEEEGSGWPARPDVGLLPFIERAWGGRGGSSAAPAPAPADAPAPAPPSRPPTPSPLPPPHAPVCGRPDCCAGPGEHVHAWWHGAGRVDLSVGRLPATEVLGGEGWWVWRAPPAGCEAARGRRVPLSPAASHLSLAHALDLAFNAPGLEVGGGPPLRAWALCLGRGRDVAVLRWRPAPPPALVLPSGPVRPDPSARAAWLRAEAGRLVRDGNAALAALTAALDAVLVGGADAAAGAAPDTPRPPPPPVAAAARAALARSAAGLGLAAADACAAVDAALAASADDSQAATTTAVSALGSARRALAKLGCTWAAHLWEGAGLWAPSPEGEAAVVAAEREAAGVAAPRPPPPPPPSRLSAFVRWFRGGGGGDSDAARRRRRSSALRGWPTPVGSDGEDEPGGRHEGGKAAPPRPPSPPALSRPVSPSASATGLRRPSPLRRLLMAGRLPGGGGGGGLSSSGGERRRLPASCTAPPPTALSGELLAAVLAAAAAGSTRKADEGWSAAIVAPCGGRAGRAAVAGGVRAALAAGDRAAALGVASLGARLGDPPSAAALARLRDPPSGTPTGPGLLALPGATPTTTTTLRLGGRALLPPGVLPLTVRDDDPSSAVAHALATPAHASFVSSVAGRALVDATLVSGTAAPADPAAAHFDAATTDDSPGPAAGRAEIRVRAWWAPHFARVRASTGAFPDDAAYAAALSRSVAWAPAGGSKSGAAFAASADGALLLKGVTRAEARSFEGLAPAYFRTVLVGERRTCLARVLGLYTVSTVRSGGGGGDGAAGPASPPGPPVAGCEAGAPPPPAAEPANPPPPPPLSSKHPASLAPGRPGEAVDFIVVENVFRGGGGPAAAFDLKGAASAARAAAEGPGGGGGACTLLDRDLLARSASGDPLTLAAADAAALGAALSADAAVLAAGGVMDFSLLAVLFPSSHDGGGGGGGGGGGARGGTLAVGLVDWLRPYSLAARVERWAKAAVVDDGPAAAPHARHRAQPADTPPVGGTVQAPARYAARFAAAVPGYFAAVPAASGADPPPPPLPPA